MIEHLKYTCPCHYLDLQGHILDHDAMLHKSTGLDVFVYNAFELIGQARQGDKKHNGGLFHRLKFYPIKYQGWICNANVAVSNRHDGLLVRIKLETNSGIDVTSKSIIHQLVAYDSVYR